MSKKAPDTRCKLDNNRNSKPKRKPKVITRQELKEITKDHTPAAIKIKMEKKPTKGQLFKQANGYSKTQKRLLTKYDLVGESGLLILKKKRKDRKLQEKKIRQEKRVKSTTFKRLNGKKKGVKTQKKPTGK